MNTTDVEALRRIATHISETLYFNSEHLKKSHSQAAERFIRHDDYDLLRDIANRGEIEIHEAKIADHEAKIAELKSKSRSWDPKD